MPPTRSSTAPCPQGARLTSTKLAEELNISKNTVREALVELRKDRLHRSRPGPRGARRCRPVTKDARARVRACATHSRSSRSRPRGGRSTPASGPVRQAAETSLSGAREDNIAKGEATDVAFPPHHHERHRGPPARRAARRRVRASSSRCTGTVCRTRRRRSDAERRTWQTPRPSIRTNFLPRPRRAAPTTSRAFMDSSSRGSTTPARSRTSRRPRAPQVAGRSSPAGATEAAAVSRRCTGGRGRGARAWSRRRLPRLQKAALRELDPAPCADGPRHGQRSYTSRLRALAPPDASTCFRSTAASRRPRGRRPRAVVMSHRYRRSGLRQRGQRS